MNSAVGFQPFVQLPRTHWHKLQCGSYAIPAYRHTQMRCASFSCMGTAARPQAGRSTACRATDRCRRKRVYASGEVSQLSWSQPIYARS